jgi:hypothetical protein
VTSGSFRWASCCQRSEGGVSGEKPLKSKREPQLPRHPDDLELVDDVGLKGTAAALSRRVREQSLGLVVPDR